MEVGHNSSAVASEQLRTIVERIERLEEEKRRLLTILKRFMRKQKRTVLT